MGLNYMKVSNSIQNFHCWVNYPLRRYMSWTHTGQRKHSQTGHMGQGKGVKGSYAGFTKPCQLLCMYCAHKKMCYAVVLTG